jgi:hypothetical protein
MPGSSVDLVTKLSDGLLRDCNYIHGWDKTCLLIYSAFGAFHHVHADNVADNSEVYAASIFMAVSQGVTELGVGICLSFTESNRFWGLPNLLPIAHLRSSHNKQRLYPETALTSWSL